MKIAFVSDLHLPKKGKKAREVDTINNFNKFLKDVDSQKIDHIIIGGDISYIEPDPDANQYVLDKINRLQIPFSVISGNHDNSADIIKCFNVTGVNDELYYVKKIEGQSFMFMDSSKGEVSEKQLNWLEDTLFSNPQINTIFIHHPIVKALVPFMDNNHALKNRQSAEFILQKQERIITVVSGHYHVEKIIKNNNIIQLITPSLFIQINQQSDTFKIDHYNAGYRILEFENGNIFSTVRYLN